MNNEKELFQGINPTYAKQIEDIISQNADTISSEKQEELTSEKEDTKQYKLNRRSLLGIGITFGAIGGFGLKAQYDNAGKSEYSFHLDGLPPSRYLSQKIIVDFQKVDILDSAGRVISVPQIDTVNSIGLYSGYLYFIKKPLLTVDPLEPDEMMVKLKISMLKNPQKHSSAYIPFRQLDDINDDDIYDKRFLHSIGVNDRGQLIGMNNKVLSDEEFNITGIYSIPAST